MHFASDDKSTSQVWLECQDWVAFVQVHELKLEEELIRIFAHSLLSRLHFQLQVLRNVDQLLSHAVLASLPVHTEVAELKVVIVFGLNIPRQDTGYPVPLLGGKAPAQGALVVANSVLLLLQLPLLLQKLCLTV